MENQINLDPLAEMLHVAGISANELSVFFDELAYDYARTVTQVASGGFVAAECAAWGN